ncbi:MAG: TlpA family protein disulfide reductase, partial [Chitinophaga sp.]
GGPAVDFTYPDLKGKQTSLSDFKGKVVLVDVWATWCGPCKGEIPHLKKLEKEMHGTDVVFMSVSVDVEKDHQKWKDFVASEELGGVQLFASGWSDIAKFYNIKGIPRFMVFDKKGNIVSTDAPRPSSKELKLLLESEAKK